MVNQHRLFYMETGVLWHFSLRSTCNITEIEDPGGCEQTDSTDAEPREEARLPRSPRRPHPASRRFSAQKNMSPRCRSSSKHRSPLLPRWIKLLCFSSFFPDLSSLRYFSSGLHPRSGGMFERFGPTSAPQHPAPVSLSAPTQQQRPHAQAQNSSWHTMNHQPASSYI